MPGLLAGAEASACNGGAPSWKKGSALEEADGVGEDEQPEQQGRSALLSSAMAGAGGWGPLASC